jgi:hypothetical protein
MIPTKATGKSSAVGKPPLAPVLSGPRSRKAEADGGGGSTFAVGGGEEEEEGRNDIDLDAYTQGQGFAGVLDDHAL